MHRHVSIQIPSIPLSLSFPEMRAVCVCVQCGKMAMGSRQGRKGNVCGRTGSSKAGREGQEKVVVWE